MHHVRRVAHQRHALGDVRARRQAPQRKLQALARELHLAERAVEILFQFALEGGRRRGQQPLGARRWQRPHDGAVRVLAMAGTPACRRQEIVATRCVHATARYSPWRRWRSGRSRCAWPQGLRAHARAIARHRRPPPGARVSVARPRAAPRRHAPDRARSHRRPRAARRRGARRRPALPAIRCSPRSHPDRARRSPRHRTPAHRRHAAARRHATPACVHRARCASPRHPPTHPRRAGSSRWRATARTPAGPREARALDRVESGIRRSNTATRAGANPDWRASSTAVARPMGPAPTTATS